MQLEVRPSNPFLPTKEKQVTDKVRCPRDNFFFPVSYCRSILGTRIKSGAFVKVRRCCWHVIFRVIVRSIYLNTTENSLAYNSLHTTTKKTHSLQSKIQIILCLPRNYCLAIRETPLKSIFSCAKNSAERELSVEMRCLIICSVQVLKLFTYAVLPSFFDPVVEPSVFIVQFFTNRVRMRHE